MLCSAALVWTQWWVVIFVAGETSNPCSVDMNGTTAKFGNMTISSTNDHQQHLLQQQQVQLLSNGAATAIATHSQVSLIIICICTYILFLVGILEMSYQTNPVLWARQKSCFFWASVYLNLFSHAMLEWMCPHEESRQRKFTVRHGVTWHRIIYANVF